MNRREFLVSSAAAGVGIALAGTPLARAGQPARAPGERRALRIAHLTDLHTQAELNAGGGVAACLRHVQGGPEKPELVLTGGDLVMDAAAATFDRTKTQWDLFMKVLREGCPQPVKHCLGNHDPWGWTKSKSGAKGDEARYGKAWALELLGMDKPYHSFDRAGWHFVALDSVRQDGEGYTAKLDDEQRAWLETDLKGVKAGTPVLVWSHIPVLTVQAHLLYGKDKDGNLVTPGASMHRDSRELHELFKKHNVRLALSGHLHRNDRVEVDGVTYICAGAVSGAWWKGPKDRCDEGYTAVDLFDDGDFDARYTRYGWKAEG